MSDEKNFKTLQVGEWYRTRSRWLVSQPGDLVANIRAGKRDDDIRIVFGFDT